MANSQVPDRSEQQPLLISFNSSTELTKWRTINDDVLGGRSLGGWEISQDALIFSGRIDTRGGGFSSIRRQIHPGKLANTDTFTITLLSDGRTYKLTVRTEERYLGRLVSYQAQIPPSAIGEWVTIDIPISAFVPSVFGRPVPAAGLAPFEITDLGFIIADRIDGPFSLRIKSINSGN